MPLFSLLSLLLLLWGSRRVVGSFELVNMMKTGSEVDVDVDGSGWLVWEHRNTLPLSKPPESIVMTRRAAASEIAVILKEDILAAMPSAYDDALSMTWSINRNGVLINRQCATGAESGYVDATWQTNPPLRIVNNVDSALHIGPTNSASLLQLGTHLNFDKMPTTSLPIRLVAPPLNDQQVTVTLANLKQVLLAEQLNRDWDLLHNRNTYIEWKLERPSAGTGLTLRAALRKESRKTAGHVNIPLCKLDLPWVAP